jgi:hypothetical protein
MKQKKTMLLALIFVAAFTFITCDDGKNDTHTHTWGAWQSNATQHWKECTANDGAKTDVANHTGNPCTMCGYEAPDPFEGTWKKTSNPNEIIVATKGTLTLNDENYKFKGTYTVSGNNVTIQLTHEWVNNMWKEDTYSITGAISGNTFTIPSNNTDSGIDTYTRQ